MRRALRPPGSSQNSGHPGGAQLPPGPCGLLIGQQVPENARSSGQQDPETQTSSGQQSSATVAAVQLRPANGTQRVLPRPQRTCPSGQQNSVPSAVVPPICTS